MSFCFSGFLTSFRCLSLSYCFSSSLSLSLFPATSLALPSVFSFLFFLISLSLCWFMHVFLPVILFLSFFDVLIISFEIGDDLPTSFVWGERSSQLPVSLLFAIGKQRQPCGKANILPRLFTRYSKFALSPLTTLQIVSPHHSSDNNLAVSNWPWIPHKWLRQIT